MQGTGRSFRTGLGMAPWIVAAALLVSVSAPAMAQDETAPAADAATTEEGALPAADPAAAEAADPAAVEAAPADTVAAEAAPADQAAAPAAPAPAADAAAADDSGGGRGGRDGQDVQAVPTVGAGPGTFSGGASLMVIGAALSAAAAGVAAFRGRLGSR